MLVNTLRHLLRQFTKQPKVPTAERQRGENLLTESAGFNRCALAREGYVVYNSNDVYIGRAIETYGEYGEIEADFLRRLLRPGAVVIEAGANMGTHTQVLSRVVGPSGFVYAYEPQRIVFQTLCANLALNSMVNVDARCAAVGAKAGYVLIPDFDYAREGNFGGIEISKFPEGRKVPKVTLDADLELTRLDLIKIDVEGMELDVLKGAEQLLQQFAPALYVENDRKEKSEALICYLLAANYQLFWHIPPLFNPNNFYENRENVYGHVVSVNMLCLPRNGKHSITGLEEITDPTLARII